MPHYSKAPRAACPDWAKSMVDNYRAAYSKANGRETELDDDQIFFIVNNMGTLQTAEETTSEIIWEMEAYDKE